MGFNFRFGSFFAAVFLISLPPLAAQTNSPQASYVDASHSTLRLEVDGKEYVVDVAAGTVRPSDLKALPAASLFASKCAGCHGANGKGIGPAGTPNFTDPQLQAQLTDPKIAETIRNGRPDHMPAFGAQLNSEQISALTAYVRSFSPSSSSNIASAQPSPEKSGIYKPGDDVLFTLPTGRPVDPHSFTVNFSHRFPYGPAFTSSPGAGISPQVSQAFGLDNFAIASLGVRYGVTDKLSVDIWRSSSFIGRPVQLMVAYNVLDEHHDQPFNLAFRFSVEGQNNFSKSYTENIEAIFSRSLTSHAQFYFVPTASFNDRRLVQGALTSDDIPDEPGINAFSLGVGIAVDIRPTLALLAEVIPTVVGGPELGIHRPPFSLAIQKKLYRHAFTFGVTTSPGTTVSQRAGTNATFLNNPSADTPSGLFLGFDLTRQIY
jgi:cytochrome c553